MGKRKIRDPAPHWWPMDGIHVDGDTAAKGTGKPQPFVKHPFICDVFGGYYCIVILIMFMVHAWFLSPTCMLYNLYASRVYPGLLQIQLASRRILTNTI
jgi:hypothetical protein